MVSIIGITDYPDLLYLKGKFIKLHMELCIKIKKCKFNSFKNSVHKLIDIVFFLLLVHMKPLEKLFSSDKK